MTTQNDEIARDPIPRWMVYAWLAGFASGLYRKDLFEDYIIKLAQEWKFACRTLKS